MASTIIDRLDGLSSSAAIKGPCKVATTANISLYGEQTIDGVAVVTGDRVLVKDQTAGYENGLYVADTGQWRRSKDFNKTRDVVKGTLVHVTDGATQAGVNYELSTANPVIIGSSLISFQVSSSASSSVRFGTKAIASAAAISNAIHAIDVSGGTALGDGLGGLYIDTNNGSTDTFTTNGGTRTWYRDRSRGRDFDVTLTVGPGGTYATLNAAINVASLLATPKYKNNGLLVNILLKAGFVMNEQVIVRRLDLGFITITAEDAEVTINPAGVTAILSAEDLTTPAFGAAYNAVLPTIGCLFTYGNSASAKDGIACHFGSKVSFLPGAGIRYCNRGLQLLYRSEAYCYMPGLTQGGAGSGAGTVTGVKFDQCKNRALHVAFGSRAGLARSDFTYNTGTGETVYVIWGSEVDLYQSAAHHSAGTAYYVRDGSRANLRECNGAYSARGIHALHNAQVDGRSKEGGAANPWILDSYKFCTEYGILASYSSSIDAAQCDVSNATARGVHASNGSTINFYTGAATDCGGEAVSAYDGSTVTATTVDTSRSQWGFAAYGGSTINAEAGSKADQCTQWGVKAEKVSRINFDSGSAIRCTLGGVWSNENSHIQARNAVVSGVSGTLVPVGFESDRSSTLNCRGAVAQYCTIGARAQEGSSINAASSDMTNPGTWGYQWLTGSFITATSTTATMSQTVNTLTVNGAGFR